MKQHHNECPKQPDLMQQKKKTQHFDSNRINFLRNDGPKAI